MFWYGCVCSAFSRVKYLAIQEFHRFLCTILLRNHRGMPRRKQDRPIRMKCKYAECMSIILLSPWQRLPFPRRQRWIVMIVYGGYKRTRVFLEIGSCDISADCRVE